MALFEERIWIEQARDGDPTAIAALYNAYKEKVFKFIFFRIGNQADSEDLFQEVMIAAFESLNRFEGRVAFLHWCYQIARNKIAYFWRQNLPKRTQTLDDNDIETKFGAPDENSDEEESPYPPEEMAKQEVSKILAKMPENYAEILKLRFLEGKTILEAAAIMNISESNAKVLQHRALKKASSLFNPDHES